MGNDPQERVKWIMEGFRVNKLTAMIIYGLENEVDYLWRLSRTMDKELKDLEARIEKLENGNE